jgi:hypothetical protein
MAHEEHTPTFIVNAAGERHWTCTCADFVKRHAAMGARYCIHTAQATMQILLADQPEKPTEKI